MTLRGYTKLRRAQAGRRWGAHGVAVAGVTRIDRRLEVASGVQREAAECAEIVANS